METGYPSENCSQSALDHPITRGYSPCPDSGSFDRGNNRELGERTITNCGGDTRWPPPGRDFSKPLNFLYRDAADAKIRIFYHLIQGNTALQVQDWMAEFDENATEAASKLSAEEQETPLIVIHNALNSKKLRPINEGPRGKLWILDEGYEQVWECMKMMTERTGAVRLMSGLEAFAVLGICLKSYRGDILLVSQPFEPND
jgi:hypothetical protein